LVRNFGVRNFGVRNFESTTIRQIAALPYRKIGHGNQASTEVLLVTSRGTGRWVLPKGNRVKGLRHHAAAEQEALEEAGVVGAICPEALGSYRYDKWMPNGPSVATEVVVYPLAVTGVLTNWKEAHERTRQWFSLPDAADAVDEDDLKLLMRRFSSADFPDQEPTGALARSERRSPRSYLAWLWALVALLPRRQPFVARFEAQAQVLSSASDALAHLLLGGPDVGARVKEIFEAASQANVIARGAYTALRRSFVTPFQRGAMMALITAIDEAIDEIQMTAVAVDVYEVSTFEQEMRDMTAIIVDAARLLSEAIPLLRATTANAERLHELTERVVHMERRADVIHARGLKRAFREVGPTNPMHFLVLREVYSRLEKVINRLEDVAQEIDSLVNGY
jgi:uncharacterized protein Yka (UPF0111/DUF47 family)/8-oxo-dGTP pyrophosphatase MutT (NUDIX family)